MKRFICAIKNCDLEFKNSKRLSEHKIRKHIEPHRKINQSFLCEICGYCTIFSFNFRTHARTHNGEKPYCCEQCGDCFASLSQLNEHRNVHRNHSNSATKNIKKRCHKCVECKAYFSSSKALYHHKKLHSKDKSYECSFCNSKFAQAAGMSQHMRLQHNFKDNRKGFPAKLTLEILE